MRLTVFVKPNTSLNKVVQIDEHTYKVFTTATPERGKANQEVLKLLADFLGIPLRRLELRFGKTAREKLIDILPEP